MLDAQFEQWLPFQRLQFVFYLLSSTKPQCQCAILRREFGGKNKSSNQNRKNHLAEKEKQPKKIHKHPSTKLRRRENSKYNHSTVHFRLKPLTFYFLYFAFK